LNTEKDISQLYNTLFQLEAKFKKEEAYPIHKKLYFTENYTDIYDYLVSTINCSEKIVLDAGCGVGYGSFLFAKNKAKTVTGISLSEEEIKRAKETKTHLKIENCTFEVRSFDAISSKFDLIFCVESLKHSLNIQKSIAHLLSSLSEKGQLILVDDFFDTKETSMSKQLQADWLLNELLSEKHLEIDTTIFNIKSEDLTSMMKQKSTFKIQIQLLFFSFFKKNSLYKKLFKGGILLDYLYTQKQMKYKLVIITKK
jgi:2-polyprenyl-3-methyl-5-hydroxy-6-metoxy-1,4-benzoquinol methylase